MLADSAIKKSRSIFETPLDNIKNIITEARDFDEAKKILSNKLVSPDFIRDFGQHLYDLLRSADALGRSFVIHKDEYFSKLNKKVVASYRYQKYRVNSGGMNWFVCADERVKVSFDLIPQDAVNYMKQKAFSIAGVENQELLNAIQSKLEAALREGQNYKEFASGVRDVIDSMGYSGIQPFRLNTIYRTNLFSAYTMGQMEQVNQVKDRFPYWRYVAIMDERTRPEHAALNGEIFPVGEGPIPPIDYNCRCSMQMVHIDELAQHMIKPLTGDDLQSLMDELESKTQVLRLDQKAEFAKWLKEKETGMDSRIKDAIAEMVN